MATISSYCCAERLSLPPTRTTACPPSTQEHCGRDDAGMGGIEGEEEFSVCSTSATTVRASNVSEERRKLLLTMSEYEDILCDADAAFSRLQVQPEIIHLFFAMISNDNGEVAMQQLALFLDFQVSLGRMLVDERDEAVEHGRRVLSIPVDAVHVYCNNHCLLVRRSVVPNIPAGIDTKGLDEISSLSGNGNAGVQAGDSKTIATNAGVMVQVANAKEEKEEKSTDIEDVKICMEENSNTTSNAGSPMEESSGGSIWVTGTAVAKAVVVDVAEEGSSMDIVTPNLVEMEDVSSGSVGGANTSNADNVVDAVAEEGSSMDEGMPNSVEMEDVSSGSVGGTSTTNADNVNGGAEE